jgi:hypothetical protein
MRLETQSPACCRTFWHGSGVRSDVLRFEIAPHRPRSCPLSKSNKMTLFKKNPTRRSVLQLFATLPAFAFLKPATAAAGDPDEIVEVNGWILKRRDLA